MSQVLINLYTCTSLLIAATASLFSPHSSLFEMHLGIETPLKMACWDQFTGHWREDRGEKTQQGTKIEKLEEPSDWRLRNKLTPSKNLSESLSQWDLVLFLRTAVVSLSFMLMLCVTQLRRMQEMIAKMQAQMQNQGAGEGEAWKVSSKSQTGGHTQHLL